LLGGAGLGMSASLPIVDKILQKKQPIAYSLHKNIVSPIKDRYMSLRGLE
jgi:hypothetical protein